MGSNIVFFILLPTACFSWLELGTCLSVWGWLLSHLYEHYATMWLITEQQQKQWLFPPKAQIQAFGHRMVHVRKLWVDSRWFIFNQDLLGPSPSPYRQSYESHALHEYSQSLSSPSYLWSNNTGLVLQWRNRVRKEK